MNENPFLREIPVTDLPFDSDAKIFSTCNDGCPDVCTEHPKDSYDDRIRHLINISGVNKDLLSDDHVADARKEME